MSSLHLYQTKNDGADLKRPRTLFAPTYCKDQRLVRCQRAVQVEQHCTIFA